MEMTARARKPIHRGLLSTASFAAVAAIACPISASAQDTAPSDTPAAVEGEIVVTASRREQTVTSLPFNISAYGGEQLQRSNIGTVAELTQQVPNFTIQDRGGRSIGSAIPIIRGLNASEPTTNGPRYAQSPVGMYLGNAPIAGGLPLIDIQRVEVLRGPQGTLYGAGALSGAVRFVPNSPKFGTFEGLVGGSISRASHSDDTGYSVDGVLNFPLGENAAFRIAAKHQYDAGFIDIHDIYKREGDDYIHGVPVAADPNDFLNSPGVLFDKPDANYARTTTARAMLALEPNDDLRVELAYSFAKVKGVGGPFDNPTWNGGPDIIDPRVTLPDAGEYERSSASLEPYHRTSHLASLDLSYDLGFATVSSTLTYGATKAQTVNASTASLFGCCKVYYTGTPAVPRVVPTSTYPDSEDTFSEEIRLVSSGDNKIDYIVGVFFQQQKRNLQLNVFAPGASELTLANSGGDTTPVVLGGNYTPTYSDGAVYHQITDQIFRDYSAFAELTWHITDRWQVTGGARLFHQTFSSELFAESANYLFELNSLTTNKVTDQIFKVNTSFKLDDRNQIYATWSQGFRRGGANAFPLDGFAREPAELIPYIPDQTDNFEIGIKGRLSGVYYSLSAFYVDWTNPQIDMVTPFNLVPAVVNGTSAESKGFEFELSGSAFVPELTFNIGGAYARARLTGDFSLPAGSLSVIVPDAIRGHAGDRLPGAPDWSGSATVNYRAALSEETSLTFSLGADYRSSTVNIIADALSPSPPRTAPGYAMLRGGLTFESGDWTVQLTGSNLLNDRKILGYNVRSGSQLRRYPDYSDLTAVSRPRTFTLRVQRKF